jgi:hypothetical protein
MRGELCYPMRPMRGELRNLTGPMRGELCCAVDSGSRSAALCEWLARMVGHPVPFTARMRERR